VSVRDEQGVPEDIQRGLSWLADFPPEAVEALAEIVSLPDLSMTVEEIRLSGVFYLGVNQRLVFRLGIVSRFLHILLGDFPGLIVWEWLLLRQDKLIGLDNKELVHALNRERLAMLAVGADTEKKVA
jgi:hypothetical protein